MSAAIMNRSSQQHLNLLAVTLRELTAKRYMFDAAGIIARQRRQREGNMPLAAHYYELSWNASAAPSRGPRHTNACAALRT